MSLPQDIVAALNQPYGEHPRQQLDLFFAEHGTRPLVVFIHGGAWESGDKRDDLAFGLIYYGYAVASINYRYSTDAPFPAQLQDCKAAVRWLRANAARFHLDPCRVAVYGASAGGHLAALMGTTSSLPGLDVGENLDQSSSVGAVVDFYGPSDLSLYGPSQPNDPLTRLFGGLTANREALEAAANPAAHAAPGDPPFLLEQGDQDTVVPPRHALVLQQALLQAGVPVTLNWVTGEGHGFHGRALKEALDAAGRFLDSVFKQKN